ncbi:hypothetical protein ABIB00_002140 [Bradyrhizobium sp. LB14.3]|uniref:hypothetical protein n=1 Tax=Bradyrhizobium sp. LB14.3 TaxID=3156328 RepID=UPI00339091CD
MSDKAHRRPIDRLAVLKHVGLLEHRYGDRLPEDQDAAIEWHLNRMIEDADPAVRSIVQRIAADIEAMYRARRTSRLHWGR